MTQEEKIAKKSVMDMFEEQYLEADNREELDYWAPLSKIIMESVELRALKNMSQNDLATAMQTKQSVVSRFENMGRLPSYDFIARLSQALGHAPGITLYGDYMAVVPLEQQISIKKLAEDKNISTGSYVQNLLEESLASKINKFDMKMTDASGLDSMNVYVLNDYPKKKSEPDIPSASMDTSASEAEYAMTA